MNRLASYRCGCRVRGRDDEGRGVFVALTGRIEPSIVRPNGDRIGFTAGTSTTQVWTLKNLSPTPTPLDSVHHLAPISNTA
jgi:hypothetical protein